MSAGRPPARSAWLFVLPAVLIFAVHARLYSYFMVDDAFISFRYARNIAAGLGPVFNPAERVEGFSNPLYTFVLAAVAFLSGHPEILPRSARVIGVVSSAAAIGLVAALPGIPLSAGAGLGVLLCAASTSLVLWSMAGLETPLYGFLIMAAFAATLARPRRRPGLVGLGLLLASVVLSRPEGCLPAAALYLWRWLDPETRRDWRGHATVGLAAAIPVAGWLLFRLVYFHDLLPNTWYAKKLPLAEAWRRGHWYLVSFVHWNGGRWLYLPAVLAFLHPTARRAAWLAGLVLAAYLPFIVIVGGDWMDHHRFLAPMAPLIYLLVGLGWDRLTSPVAALLQRWPGGPGMRLVRPLLLAGVLAALALPAVRHLEAERRAPYVNAYPYYAAMGELVGAVAPPEWSVATHDIGAIGWFGRTRVVDLLGLVDRDLARGRVTADGLVAAQRPELVILHYDNRTPPAGRWRPVDGADFEMTYVPASRVAGIPGSLWVRGDCWPAVAGRLRTLPPGLARRMVEVNAFLETRQPDGRPIVAAVPAGADTVRRP